MEVTEKEKDPFVTPYLEVVLPAGISDTVEIKRDDPENSVWVPEDVPGLLGAAYDFSAEEEIKEAEIAFKFDRKFLDNENFNPQIYYIDTEKQEMYPLEDQEVDLDNCVVKARTAHFSKYALIDTYLWDQAWKDDIIAGEQDKLNARIDVAFVLDESGSMASNDRRNVRVQVSKNFIDILRNEEKVHDRGAVIGFASSARLLSPFTNDHEALKKALDNIRASGGTSLSSGISLALGQFPLPSVDLPDTDDNSLDKIPQAVLMQMIRELPEGYRTVFNLYVFEDKSHKEIASILGITERTSSSQFYRAKSLLIKKINEYRKKESQ